jgi:hypothetical protein
MMFDFGDRINQANNVYINMQDEIERDPRVALLSNG